MADWLKTLVLGYLQSYIYEQAQDVVGWVNYLAKGKTWVTEEGGLSVPPEDLLDFTKTFLKALATAVRNGSPPSA